MENLPKTRVCKKCLKRRKRELFKFAEGYLEHTCLYCRRIKNAEWRANNKDKIKIISARFGQKHKAKLLAYNRKFLSENKEWATNYRANYYIKNKARIRKRMNKNHSKRYEEDMNYRLAAVLRSRINAAMNGRTKSKNTQKLIGCTIDALKAHLESKFTDGMTWDNYGYYGWHIDHIKPCAKFDLTKVSEQEKCFSYKNMQPLWHKDNLKKRDKYTDVQRA